MNKKIKKGEYFEAIIRSKNTIFTTKDVALIWGEKTTNTTNARLSGYVKAGKLVRLYRGLYAKDKNYNKYELATRIYTPAYISFETVLGATGVTFQHYGNIFVASEKSKEIEVDGNKITFVRIKNNVLTNNIGILHEDGYAISIPERAFLDRIYVSSDYHFDNLSILDFNKIFKILPLYNNKRMERQVNIYYKDSTNKK